MLKMIVNDRFIVAPMSVDEQVTPQQRSIYQQIVEFVHLCVLEVKMPPHTIVRVAFDNDSVPSYCDTSKLEYNTVFVNVTASGDVYNMIRELAIFMVKTSVGFSMHTTDVSACVGTIITLHDQAMAKLCQS